MSLTKDDKDIAFEQDIDLKHNENPKENDKTSGFINKSDFITWSVIPLLGIFFCFLHAEQEHLWQWTAGTAKDAQTLEAKIVISIISTIIGSCSVAVLAKSITGLAYTVLKNRGASFSQLVALIGGFLPSYIPMLSSGDGWLTIITISLILAVSVISKQLAVISMGISSISTNATVESFTANYTTCNAISLPDAVEGVRVGMSLNIYNSLINRNTSFTNEFYDKAIPHSLIGNSTFYRVLPYSNVSCGQAFNSSSLWYSNVTPLISKKEYAWETVITMPLNDEVPMVDDIAENSTSTLPSLNVWINCSISAGYASALSTCNDTYCVTNRVSDITPYTGTGYGIPAVLLPTLGLLISTYDYKNPMMAWLMGGSLTEIYLQNYTIPGRSEKVIQERVEILSTVLTRLLCDYNNGMAQRSTTPIISVYAKNEYYQYHILWKWPFYVVAACIFFGWVICMWTLWKTPESRIISVEWLLSQYILKGHLTYLSGKPLIQSHNGSLYQIMDESPDEATGTIVISKSTLLNVMQLILM
ncbi:hypothetical protein INT48_008993 [Thamnidium elegans]|uniref:Uncharacterized protein n=1 Tax=Thamnidium elegans TaxID=101142 RepID=A0A8H7VVT7_9FUNG|nr:hypothetical protein INT48_008993 [Thamnidium elegans]